MPTHWLTKFCHCEVACAHKTVTLLNEFLYEHGLTTSRGYLLQSMQEGPNIAYVQSGTDEEVGGRIPVFLLHFSLFAERICLSLSCRRP